MEKTVVVTEETIVSSGLGGDSDKDIEEDSAGQAVKWKEREYCNFACNVAPNGTFCGLWKASQMILHI